MMPRSISRRLTRMNLMVAALALLLACASFFIYDQYTVRAALVQNLSAQAELLGNNSISAITFNDPVAAERMLSALRNLENIESAGIVTTDGRMFAQYIRPGSEQVLTVPVLDPGQEQAHWFRRDELTLVRRIDLDNKPIGAIYISTDLSMLYQRLMQYVLISLGVLLLSLLAAWVFSQQVRRSIANPIVGLAKTTQDISREGNYSLRAEPADDPREVSILIDSFNKMLTEIEQRDEALRNSQSDLERRVQERTRQLVATNRELEAFAYSVSHDLKSPLEAINGFTYLLGASNGPRMDETGREYLEQVRAATMRMSTIIDDLLKLSQVATGVMHREKVDLSLLAQRVANDLKRSQPARHVEFIIAEGLIARADIGLLQIVIENLLRNAWKYTSVHPQACIEFGAAEIDGETAYFVRDDGAGFDPALAGRLFQPFKRLHSNAQFPGTGIGLATVQRIVHRHGGRIWAEGAIDRGATFYFTLGSEQARTDRIHVV